MKTIMFGSSISDFKEVPIEVEKMSSGAFWTFLVSVTGELFVVGKHNHCGQMGVGTIYVPVDQPYRVPFSTLNPSDRITHISCGYDFSAIVVNSSLVYT